MAGAAILYFVDAAYLIIDAFQVGSLVLPELNLNKRSWVQTLQEWLGRVFLQDITDLVCPINDNGLNSVDNCFIQSLSDN